MDFGQMNPSYPPNWLSASYYSNIPHNEVNWAALAQQWIAMRQAGDSNCGGPVPPVQAPPPLPPSQPHVPSAAEVPVFPPSTSSFPKEKPGPECATHLGNVFPPADVMVPSKGPPRSSGPLLATPHIPPLPDGFYDRARPERLIPPKPLIPPLRHRFPPYPSEPTEQSFYDRNTVYTSWSENDAYGEDFYAKASYDAMAEPYYQHPVSGGQLPAQDMDYRKWRGPFFNQKSWMNDRSSSNSPDVPLIDLQQRKLLPAWIREGLEKVEREKQKKQEEELKKAETTKILECVDNNRSTKGRFESDSESDNEPETSVGNKMTGNKEEEEEKLSRKVSPSQKRISRFEPSPLSEEESKENLLSLLRKWMTEILLEVTDKEIQKIVSDFHARMLRKAQPKMLAQSSALAAISSFGPESEESSEEESEKDDGGGSEKEEEDQREGFKRPLEPFSSVIRPVSKQRKQIISGSEPQSKHFKDGASKEFAAHIDSAGNKETEKGGTKEIEGEKLHDSGVKPDKKSLKSKSRNSRSRSKSRERDAPRRKRRSRSRSRSTERNSDRKRDRKSGHHQPRKDKRRSRSKERDHKHRKSERRRS